MYHLHELNRIVCLGMYYVLIEDRIDRFLNPDGTLKENVVFDLPTKNDTQIPKLDITNKERGK